MKQLEIRGAGGLGDAIYQLVVAKYYSERGYDITFRTKWAELYQHLNVKTKRFYKIPRADMVAGYSNRKEQKTNQFQDILINCKIDKDYPFDIGWVMTDKVFIDKIKKAANGKKIILVSLPHWAFGTTDGMKRMPFDFSKLQFIVDRLHKKGFYLIQIGSDHIIHKLNNIDLDLNKKTTTKQTIDLASICDGMVGQVGNIVPMAEAFNKPLISMFSSKAIKSGDWYCRTITPKKILSGKNSKYILDNYSSEQINKVIEDSFYGKMD